MALYTAGRYGRIVPTVLPEDEDQVAIPEQRQPVPARPRIAPAQLLFDRSHRNEHRDALDALAALGPPSDHHC